MRVRQTGSVICTSPVLCRLLLRYRKWCPWLTAVIIMLSLSGWMKSKLGATPSLGHLHSGVNQTIRAGPAAESEEVKKFRQHISWIHSLVQKSYARVLEPWKLNQNVTVSIQEDAFGNPMLRVICLQNFGTPGVMQVGVELEANTEYEVRVEGCTLPSADASKFQACTFIDQIGADRSSQLAVWNCSAGLAQHKGAANGELPCSDLDFYQGLSKHNRFEHRVSFSTQSRRGQYRIGTLFSGAQPGDTFFLKEMCWRPTARQQPWNCGYR